jgi:hypothetical protein
MSKAVKYESDKVASKTLSATRSRIKAATPVGFTGETRRAWVVQRRTMGSYRTFNKQNAAWFLEHGTNDHGPVRKPMLFIPLNKRGFYVYRANVFPPLIRARSGRPGDYILVPYVKGIKPRRMVARNVNFAAGYGVSELAKMLNSI